jgi:hypothetical protein
MIRNRTNFIFMAALATVAALGSASVEAVQRTHVSAASGSDSNTAANCSPAAPCRTFQAAMSVTDTNGEVIALDSGGYGAVNITKSVAIIAPVGVYAGISVFPGSNGVTIATAGVDVVLRGININSQGGNNGILMTRGASLTVENCVISNFTLTGAKAIGVITAAKLSVFDTVFRNNYHAITVEAGASAVITRVTVTGILDLSRDILVYNESKNLITVAAIKDSTMSGGLWGVLAQSTGLNAAVRVSVLRSTLTKYSFGIAAESYANSPVVATVGDVAVTESSVGMYSAFPGAVLRTFGNNTFDQNLTNSSGDITLVPSL